MPYIGFLAPSYAGFDDTLHNQPVLVGPGARMSWGADWSGLCEHQNLFDSSSTEPCDAQSYTISIVCSGVACSTDPADALGDKGHHAHGSASVALDASKAGTLDATATITRGATTRSDHQVLDIVEPDSLVLECRYEPSGSYPYVDCPTAPSAYFEGSTFLFYVYAKKGGQMVDVGADLAIEGFSFTPGIDPTGMHDTAYLTAPAPGTHTVTASFHGLSASYTVTLN